MIDDTFTAYDIRGRVEEGASLELAWNIGKALAEWLPTYGDIVLVRGDGGDERLVGALVEGARLQGRDVIDYGEGEKTILVDGITEKGSSGGIYVAHDSEQNVSIIELFDDKGQPIVAENGLNDIAELVQAGNFVPSAEKGELRAA